MPSFTLRERFRRIRHPQSMDDPSSRSSTTEKVDEAPPSYLAVGLSSPQTVRRASFPPSSMWMMEDLGPDLDPFIGKNEGRKAMNEELSRLTMEPTSTVEWAKFNRFRHADRFRTFLYHCLLWQYKSQSVPQTKLSKEDERHFLLLWCLLRIWWHYYSHEHENFDEDDEFINRVINYMDVCFKDPVIDILNLRSRDVIATMRPWVGEVRWHYGCRWLINNKKTFYDYSVEAAAKRGDWEELGKKFARDVELVDIVAPYGDQEARKALVNAVRQRQQHYLAMAAGSPTEPSRDPQPSQAQEV